MTAPKPISGVAYNQVPDAANEIHGDRIAKLYGFRGGLVPGVAVSAYVCEPAVRAWGAEFLERGRARVVVKKPLYEDEPFDVLLGDVRADGYDATLRSATDHCAEGQVTLAARNVPAPRRRGDKPRDKTRERPVGTPTEMARLQESGLCALLDRWDMGHRLGCYYRDGSAMPHVHTSAGGGYATLSFLLGQSNVVLEENVRISPWVHLQTESQSFASVEPGTDIVTEATICDLFDRKGHQFVDLDANIFRARDDAAVMSIRLRAIYQLRQ